MPRFLSCVNGWLPAICVCALFAIAHSAGAAPASAARGGGSGEGVGGWGPVVFETNTTIDDGDFAFDGMDIVVRGATVTINGAHTFNSLTVERNGSNQAGVVTHGAGFAGGVFLTIAGDVVVQGAEEGGLVASAINVSAKGHAADAGPGAGVGGGTLAGGAGHGGLGGFGGEAAATGGPTYGSLFEPTDLGSGGGTGNSGDGGAGGGALHLFVGGTLTVDGAITANGAGGGFRAGGGSGGSIWIDAGTLAGAGTITASGGTGSGGGGGGGGGRVVIYAENSTLGDLQLSAFGAVGQSPGGAGTIYQAITGLPSELIVGNGGIAAGATVLAGEVIVDLLHVRAAGRLGPQAGASTLEMSITGDVLLDAGTLISADGLGQPAGVGDGAGASGTTLAGGAGHGGLGGAGAEAAATGGAAYGSLFAPVDPGSGGGTGNSGSGGSGGGVIRLSVGGTLTVEGTISANGAGGGFRAGGGSGGSIWIEAGTLAGAGAITASGGTGSGGGGGGSGGRIALYAGDSTLTDSQVRAFGAAGQTRGGAGTIYQAISGLPTRLVVDNNGVAAEMTVLDGEVPVDLLHVRNGGRVGPQAGSSAVDLTVTGDVLVDVAGGVTVTGRGEPADTGPGAGSGGEVNGGGAGYGGLGGAGAEAAAGGGAAYGSLFAPVDPGSGGATGNSTPGGAGGGVIRLVVGGTLTVDGFVGADGSPAGFRAGGGSGGSIWIDAGTLAGAGVITASGGAGNSGGGGGGGGRIALYADGSTLTESQVQAFGALGQTRGGAGTIYQAITGLPTRLVVDNNGAAAEVTVLDGEVAVDLLHVRNGGRVGPQVATSAVDLTVTGDVLVDVAGGVTVTGRGEPADTGAGAGSSGEINGGGAGHGGVGGPGAETAAAAGPAYGSIHQPIDPGSGGGTGNSSPAGAGGGVIRLVVGGTLTVDGFVGADGAPAGFRAGGGSGGSIWIDAGTLAGAGVITASGGAGNSGGGGGGGGRIALYAGDSTLGESQVQAYGAAGQTRGGAGTIFRAIGASPTELIVDNGGNASQPTPLAGDLMVDLLHVRNGGRVGPQLDSMSLDVTVDNVLVGVAGAITASGRGHGADAGPGAGVGGPTVGGGGGHGGMGGAGSEGAAMGGTTYGSLHEPVDAGSGGATGNSSPGGAGGGVLRLTVTGALTVEGAISADGAAAGFRAGGGSGGSIWIDAAALTGNGTITANGGTGNSGGGGGGGGRIAIYCSAAGFQIANVTVNGGIGSQSGGSGTLRWTCVCPQDWNGDQMVNTADFFEFFSGFFGVPPDADFNRDGSTNTADFFEFFAAFFGPPCP